MGKPEKESKKDKKESKKDKKEVKAVEAGAAEEKVFDYESSLKKCTIISKPMASEKLTKKVLKATKKGISSDTCTIWFLAS